MFLFKVEDTFQITGRGLILVPGLGTNADKVSIGMIIKLKKPDKTEIVTTIAGIAFARKAPLLLPKEIKKEDVPIGTEVWLETKNE